MNESAPNSLRLVNPAKFWTIDVPRRVGPVLAVLVLVQLIACVVFADDLANPGMVVGLIVQGAVVVGIVAAVLNGTRRGHAESIEFGERFRIYDRGHPISFDWDQLEGMWYEGTRNPTRVNVTAVKPNRAEDRVLIVGVRGGSEIRIRVAAVDQSAIFDWARYVESLRDLNSRRASSNATIVVHSDVEGGSFQAEKADEAP